MRDKKNNLPIIIISIATFILMGIFVINFLLVRANIHLDNQTKEQKIYSMYEEYKNSFFPKISDISIKDLLKLQDRENILFIDVREPMEQEVSMIAGALTTDEFDKNIDKYKDYTIVTYCTAGYRSGIYSERLLKNKDIKSYNMIGGILSWVHNGGKVYIGRKETNRVHVYSKKFDLLPESYKATR